MDRYSLTNGNIIIRIFVFDKAKIIEKSCEIVTVVRTRLGDENSGRVLLPVFSE